MAAAGYRVRDAVEADVELLVALNRALAAYHGQPEAARVTAEDVRRDGFGARPRFFALIAEQEDGTAVGFAQCYEGYASWLGRPMLVVGNIYVDAALRGGGVGRLLMGEVARRARALGCPRIELHVTPDNPAVDFYRRLGMRVLADKRCRLDAAAVQALAEG